MMTRAFYGLNKTLRSGINLKVTVKSGGLLTSVSGGIWLVSVVHPREVAWCVYFPVSLCVYLSVGESCTHWHGLAAVEGADCRLSLSMCGELDEGAT